MRKLLILLPVLLIACRPPTMWLVDPSGPDEYKLGWEDGCDTGTAAEK